MAERATGRKRQFEMDRATGGSLTLTQYYYAVRGGGFRFSLSQRREKPLRLTRSFRKHVIFNVTCRRLLAGLVKNNAHVVLLRARGIQLAFYSGCASLFILYSLYSPFSVQRK